MNVLEAMYGLIYIILIHHGNNSKCGVSSRDLSLQGIPFKFLILSSRFSHLNSP